MGVPGVEPGTSSLSVTRSNHLSYTPIRNIANKKTVNTLKRRGNITKKVFFNKRKTGTAECRSGTTRHRIPTPLLQEAERYENLEGNEPERMDRTTSSVWWGTMPENQETDSYPARYDEGNDHQKLNEHLHP